MKFLTKCKDGGKDSPVDAYVLIEIKGLFSIMLLKFNKGKREAYHTHAFNALTWFLWGDMKEDCIGGFKGVAPYKQSLFPKLTKRDNLHRVVALKDSWCFTLRGPWKDTWEEYLPKSGHYVVLTHGRKELSRTRHRKTSNGNRFI